MADDGDSDSDVAPSLPLKKRHPTGKGDDRGAYDDEDLLPCLLQPVCTFVDFMIAYLISFLFLLLTRFLSVFQIGMMIFDPFSKKDDL